MAAVFELVVEGDGVPPHSVSVGKRPFSIGRGPGNDLVVPDGMVSWEHLKVWSDRGIVWCSDAGSTNGTKVNGTRISGTVQLNAGDRITVGDKLQLHLQLHGSPSIEVSGQGNVALEEVATGLKHPFRSTRFIVGSAPDCDLRIQGALPYAAEFAIHAPDDIWLMVDTEDQPVELDRTFEIAGMEFRLVRVSDQRAPTIQPQKDRFPYTLMATLDGPTGPVAELVNIRTGNRVRVEAETRAILLYLLGRRVAEDRRGSTAKEEIGWLPDDDVIVGVWGRSGLPDGANRLKVLVHRLRSEIKRGGFDPWFIERRRRFIRVRVREFTNPS